MWRYCTAYNEGGVVYLLAPILVNSATADLPQNIYYLPPLKFPKTITGKLIAVMYGTAVSNSKNVSVKLVLVRDGVTTDLTSSSYSLGWAVANLYHTYYLDITTTNLKEGDILGLSVTRQSSVNIDYGLSSVNIPFKIDL